MPCLPLVYSVRLTIAVLLAVGVIAHSASAVERTDFKVNGDGGSAEHSSPRIAVSVNGDFAVVWVDRRSGSADIYLQRYGSDGFPVGANKLVNDDAAGVYQTETAIAVDQSGLYSVVWKDYRNGEYPFNPDIYFQRYDTSLAPSGANRQLTSESPDSLKETPDIALSPWGGGIVVWADYRNHNWDIYGQLVSSNGALMGSNFKVNDDAGTFQQHAPRVAVSPEGWFAVAWYDNRNGNDDIFAQCYDSLAHPLGANLRVNSDSATARQAFPDVATDGRGHFTVVWVDWRNGNYPGNPEIYSRKFALDLTPITDDQLVNQDGNRLAQREPAIAADRRGNVAIIWSDSSASSWDIVGQMIDVDGVIREANFQANTDADSAQLQPDVALDGSYRYVTWADKRRGHFDIYASITEYNDPSLTAEPDDLHFEMLAGGDVPDEQQVVIEHTGYNPIDFDIVPSHGWLGVSPTSGLTPDTVTVGITTDTLPYGTYLAELALYDRDNDDTSAVITVRLDVTAPILDLSTDSLYLRGFAGVDDSISARVIVSNSGAGDLNWSAAESADWLQLSPGSGAGGDTLNVWVSAVDLAAGVYSTSIIVDAGSVINSPDTLPVVLDVVENMPYLAVQPEELYLSTTDPASIDTSVAVFNAGVGILNWTATGSDPWINFGPASALGDATVSLGIDTTGLSPGLYEGWIDFVDSASFNVTRRLPVTLDYLIPSADTLEIGSSHVTVGESGQFSLALTLLNDARSISCPVEYDTSLVTIDSVVFNPSLPGFLQTDYTLDAGRRRVSVSLVSIEADSTLTGSMYVGDVFFSAGPSEGVSPLTEPSDLAPAAVVIEAPGTRLHPFVKPGEIQISAATAVDPLPSSSLPKTFQLGQNYPNPFNPSTTIELAVPRMTYLRLEVFNILGQQVRTLLDQVLSAGEYRFVWNGDFDSGRPCPSGIYFYRLKAGDLSFVRKMALIK